MGLPLLTSSVPEPLLVRPRSSATTESAVLPATSEPPSETDKNAVSAIAEHDFIAAVVQQAGIGDRSIRVYAEANIEADRIGTADLNRVCAVNDQRAVVHSQG